jgi:hypothetical protein
MANTCGNAKTARSSQSGTQAKAVAPGKPKPKPTSKPTSKPKPKPTSKAKGKGKSSNVVPTSDQEEEDDALSGEYEGDDQEALLSKIKALERQLGKKKKGGSVDPVIEAQREGKLFTWDGKLLKCSFQSQGNVLSPCLNKMRWGGMTRIILLMIRCKVPGAARGFAHPWMTRRRSWGASCRMSWSWRKMVMMSVMVRV